MTAQPTTALAYKCVPLHAEIKANDGAGEFEGYASTWEKDLGGDMIVQGAFAPVIETFLKDGFIDLGHSFLRGRSQHLPIATPIEAAEDDKGLFIRAAFHSTQLAQDARVTMKERLDRGMSVGLSIGYLVDYDHVEYYDDGDSLVRVIGRMKELPEVSIVTMPMNPNAQATLAKGRTFADELDDALAAAVELRDRARALAALRVKEGRTLSESNRSRLGTQRDALRDVADELDALIVETNAAKPRSSTITADHAFYVYQQALARLQKVVANDSVTPSVPITARR